MRDAAVMVGIREPQVFLQRDAMLPFQFIQRERAIAVGIQALPRGIGRDVFGTLILRYTRLVRCTRAEHAARDQNQGWVYARRIGLRLVSLNHARAKLARE